MDSKKREKQCFFDRGPAPKPPGFIALVPIPKGRLDGPIANRPPFGFGPRVGARVGSHRCPILRPGRSKV